MTRLALCLILAGSAASAETLVASRTIPARTIIGPGDIVVTDATVPGAITSPDAAIGLEAKVALYAGRPVRAADLGPPAVVERNQIIPLIYANEILTISTEGRAMDRAGPGETIRVMNLSSRNTVSALIGPDGTAYVSR
ncbi:flagellar basal body P-ring formation chaperone FlgA [Flavimaricola marinus]|uniref:Flagella basal body P-ring formation protein FlgA n=1 Tax=Flavimaricola marinus TaxID=1819565 RepID=A0A238LF21_9RHOB|nr:flagellar basal body P-ring formation chaperone FlgA [Flavimaricola marinus]SMY08231.1 flagellar basal body P-ring biosynthesis protein FlgA [Flavimaricola marinus]